MLESANLSLGLRIFSWCLAILIVSVLALTFRSLGPLELRYVDIKPLRLSVIDSSTVVFPLYSTDDAPAMYFHYVLEIVGRLKRAGARVVLVPIPPTTQYTPEIQSIVRKIAAYDNVVFGDQLRAPSPYQDLTDRQLDDPANWWASHPMNHLVPMFWGVSSVRVSQSGALLRFVPDQYRESMKGYQIPDVALQVIKRYLGYPDSLPVTRHFGTVIMGQRKIPVAEDGFAYVKSTIMPYYRSSIYAYAGPENTLLRYGGQWVQGREIAVTDSTWNAMAGKIVIINWPHLSSRIRWYLTGYAGAYIQVINAILTNTFVHRYDQWNLAIIFLAVILAGALVFSIRTWLAVLILIVCEVLAVFTSLWLFSSHNAIYDPVYLLFAVTLCVTILPVAKVTYEKEYFRKQLVRSKEEIAVLEEQLGNSGESDRGVHGDLRPRSSEQGDTSQRG